MSMQQFTVPLTFVLAGLSSAVTFADVIDVSQETSPGSGTFVPVGTIESVTTSQTIDDLYAWSPGPTAEYNGSIMIPMDDETLVWVHKHEGTGALSLVVLHDDPDGLVGGSARTIVEVAGDPDGAAFVVLDDDPISFADAYPQVGPLIFEADQGWGSDRGDGFVVGALDGDWSCELDLLASNGLLTLSAGDLDHRVSLNVAPGRRIRLVGRYGTTEAFCPPALNSTGQGTRIEGTGSFAPASGGLTLQASELPSGTFGYFLMSARQDVIATSGDGVICLASPTHRFSNHVLVADAAGNATLSPDLDSLAAGFAVTAGSAWNFQYWHRDANPGLTSNTSNGLTVFFVH